MLPILDSATVLFAFCLSKCNLILKPTLQNFCMVRMAETLWYFNVLDFLFILLFA